MTDELEADLKGALDDFNARFSAELEAAVAV